MAEKTGGKTAKGKARSRSAEGKAKQVTFRLDAPQAGTVFIAGDFTGWDAKPLKQRKDGTWWANVNLQPGVYQYKFVVDGAWQEDPEGDRKVQNDYGTYNSVREVA
jgi:1,4-alpha-glucan branching enzyme